MKIVLLTNVQIQLFFNTALNFKWVNISILQLAICGVSYTRKCILLYRDMCRGDSVVSIISYDHTHQFDADKQNET